MPKPFKVSPFLKWLGGKTKLIDLHLANLLPKSFSRYHEPFLGGGSMFLEIRKTFKGECYLSDANYHLINCYKELRDNPGLLIHNLQTLKHNHLSAENPRNYYYIVRDETQPDSQSAQAARFIYLNKAGFRGMYRENKQGKFNVPYGAYKNPQIYSEENLLEWSRLLQGCSLECCSFTSKVKLQTNTNDFIYLDPPYDRESSEFIGYTATPFAQTEHRQLALYLKYFDYVGSKFMLSNSATELTKSLYSDKGYNYREILAPRNISIDGNRTPTREIIVWNY